jgi:hypothetical protein
MARFGVGALGPLSGFQQTGWPAGRAGPCMARPGLRLALSGSGPPRLDVSETIGDGAVARYLRAKRRAVALRSRTTGCRPPIPTGPPRPPCGGESQVSTKKAEWTPLEAPAGAGRPPGAAGPKLRATGPPWRPGGATQPQPGIEICLRRNPSPAGHGHHYPCSPRGHGYRPPPS